MIKGWNADLSVILSYLWTPSVQRSLYKSRKAQNSGMSRRGNAKCWVRHRMRSSVLIFQKKKTTDLRLRLIHLLIQLIFKEHLFCSGVLCLLLWLQTWKGRNELPSQIYCCNHSWSDFPAFCKWFLEFISSVYTCVVSEGLQIFNNVSTFPYCLKLLIHIVELSRGGGMDLFPLSLP